MEVALAQPDLSRTRRRLWNAGRLADNIIATQVRKIAEMNALTGDLERNPPAGPRLPAGSSLRAARDLQPAEIPRPR